MSLLNENPMPAIFFGHGSPGNILEDNTATRMWQQLGKELPKPKGIICVSAHWYTSNTAITSMESPKTIHDFGGFPKAMYEMQYPAPGSLELASKLSVILAEENAQLDSTWGFDHGTWCVLAKVFPKADVPVVQLSINNTKDMAFHFRVGQKLAELRKQGYWVIGSGNIVHNLGVMDWNKRNMTFNWAQRFGDYIRDAVSTNTPENVINYLDFGAEAKMSVPHPDHFIPLLYVLGARLTDDDCRFETTYAEYGSLDMTSIIFN
ncbi:4,5-DOPA dioxygenase extradiol [uncultured Paraglaciecola sp.]|uniref:4,5-DOPA-extradiol-dioxygenase n=1 Tax=uncultured Paraglaciecola sp. TaxID=1765024 RepID=UPI0030D9D229|tara:strand:- start:511304 stop:512092 length:789 start_codon:yes stop_codon:yes gene_type:complete